jgi:hypothetical protein
VQRRPSIATQQQLCRIHEMMTQHKFYKKKKKKKKQSRKKEKQGSRRRRRNSPGSLVRFFSAEILKTL